MLIPVCAQIHYGNGICGALFYKFWILCVYKNIPGFVLELREYEPTTPLPLSSSKFNRGVRQMFEDMEISVK
jgi:hypothetical protein